VPDEIDNPAEETEITETVTPATSPSSLPLTITLVALLLFFAVQTVQLILERGNLSMVKSNQDSALQEAQKVQEQFKTLVTKTNQLAEQGHAGARMVMEGLQRQGLGAPPQPESRAPSKAETKPAK
jgi:FtsZ-binding cell division protein ZapB